MMMSGLSIGMSFRKVIIFRLRPLRLCMPMAEIVPRIVDRNAEIRPMERVFSMALTRELFKPPLKTLR